MALRQIICSPLIRGGCKIASPTNFYQKENSLLYRQWINHNFRQQIRTGPQRNNRGGGGGLQPFQNVPADSGPVPTSTIWKSLVFTVAFSGGSFMAVSIWEYEQYRSKAMKALKNVVPFHWFKQKLHNGNRRMNVWQKDVDSWWASLTPGQRVFAPICALNILVFGLWRVPRFQPAMIKYFCANPAARAVCWPMFLSTFSHYSAFHIFANMYVLHSFSNAAVQTLGNEQFLGFYLSAGVISAFASHLYKAFSGRAGFSLGASGAIMAILGYVCTQYPDTQLSIIFLPMYQFSAGVAIKFIMGIDLAGLLLGWRYFDHAAHLGGVLFGLFWCYYGSHAMWPKREKFLQYYHSLRTPSPPTR